MRDKAKPGVFAPHLPDDVSVRRWVAAYAAYFALLAVPLAVLIAAGDSSRDDWTRDTVATFRASPAAAKLLAVALYLSLCCTFLPLPSMWMASAVATQQVAVTGDLWTTTLTVAAVGAFGSTMANLNDYHIFTWLLRHHRIAAVRHTRTYQRAARWFSRSPFLILVIFNLMPIPVDVVRMLATTYRYPRVPFAAANYVGRFIRYGVIALVTYRLADYGWVAVVALLALALALGLGRGTLSLARRLRGRRAGVAPDEQSAAELPSRES